MAERIPTRLSARQGRSFGLTVGGAFLVLTGLFLWRDKDILMPIAGSLGAFFILGGLLFPTRMGPVERAWMRLAHLISKVTTPVFLGVLYLVVFMPVGAVMRLLGKNPMERRISGDGYWVARAQTDRRSNLQRQF